VSKKGIYLYTQSTFKKHIRLCFSAPHKEIRKDVECTLGILKKRWNILEYGIHFHDIKVVENVFIVCFMLHNMMFGDAETSDSRV
jgi:hypothetical protein